VSKAAEDVNGVGDDAVGFAPWKALDCSTDVPWEVVDLIASF
jgi:hypothetical protein